MDATQEYKLQMLSKLNGTVNNVILKLENTSADTDISRMSLDRLITDEFGEKQYSNELLIRLLDLISNEIGHSTKLTEINIVNSEAFTPEGVPKYCIVSIEGLVDSAKLQLQFTVVA